MAQNISAAFIIENMSGSSDQHNDHDGDSLNVAAAKASHQAAPIVRIVAPGPINLRGRPSDEAYKITVG